MPIFPFLKTALLQTGNILVQQKRFRGKINIKHPRKPHFEKALFNAATAPIYERIPIVQKCREAQEARLTRQTNVKEPSPYEAIIAREVLERFDSASIILACHLNSIKQYDWFKYRVSFHQKGATLKTYGPRIIEFALRDSKYRKMLQLFSSKYAVIFSSEENLPELLKILKKTPKLLLLAGIAENRFMNRNELVKYSELPSLDIVRAQFAATLFSPGNSIVSKLQSHQSNLCSLLDVHAKALGESNGKTVDAEKTDPKESNEKPPEEAK